MQSRRSQEGELLLIDDNIDQIRRGTKKRGEEEELDCEFDSNHSASTLELEEREEDVEDIQKMVDANLRPMKEFARPVVETSPSCILLDATARNYELKNTHHNMIPSFYGVASEDSLSFICDFYATIQTLPLQGLSEDQLQMRSANFGSKFRTAQNELENEVYMLGKLRMSIFWSISQIVNIIFLEEVMAVLTLKVEHALAAPTLANKDFWCLHVDSSSNYKGSGIGLVLVTPDDSMLEQAITLGFKASNNELIINQATGEYAAKYPRMTLCFEKVRKKLEAYQRFKLILALPASELYPQTSPWLFMQWAIDLVRPMPPATESRGMMIVATDCFTKKEMATNLDLAEGEREKVIIHIATYLQQLLSSYNKRAKIRQFQPGDLVLRKAFITA
ncbi:S ribonuclease [Pyrus ussuriensis x Pyrus communis]|uniref:S ribonuclease n=1 Tax=Pyrus ussuriensis x Pyrus communis TaxID=2448454 RepID=A0A5N5FWF9_9ROSA|nr:S ribonuclease [Pyrus ussuriensis x Pyrus communis]